MARPGGVNEPIHNFSLVEQDIQVRANGHFHVRFPNVWDRYKLPKVTEKEVYDNWLSSQMQFWQNQLNFAVWCATTGCGVSKEHLRHKDPMTRSVFRFHAYYQIRRILSEMSCPLPTEDSWNPLNNGINMNAYERICNEFGVSPKSNWRQHLDPMNGMGYAFYHSTHTVYTHHKMRSHKEQTLEKAESFNLDKFTVEVRGPVQFGKNNHHFYRVEYIEQTFHKESGYADRSPDGTPMAAIGSFVLDVPYDSGFWRAGISRINDSVRTYAWAILGSQSQARSSILGSGKAFDAQKQFLANVEDAINSEVDLPSSIDRYQRTLQYARSKVDFVIGHGLYMLPSNMEMEVGVVNGYNNLIQIATDDMQLGFNASVNESSGLTREVSEPDADEFETLAKPELVEATGVSEPAELELTKPELVEATGVSEPAELEPTKPEPVEATVGSDISLTHDERKLSLIVAGVAIVSVVAWLKT